MPSFVNATAVAASVAVAIVVAIGDADDAVIVMPIMIINIICGNYFESKVLSKRKNGAEKERSNKKTDDGILWILFTYEHIIWSITSV